MAKLKHTDLVKAMTTAKARWRATETPVSRLSEAQQKALLGAVPSAEVTAAMAAMAAAPPQAPAPTFAPAVDWRNRNGNHIPRSRTRATADHVSRSDARRWWNRWRTSREGCGSICPRSMRTSAPATAPIAAAGGRTLPRPNHHTRGECDEAAFPYAIGLPQQQHPVRSLQMPQGPRTPARRAP